MCLHWQELAIAGEEEITLITPSYPGDSVSQGSVLAVCSQAHAVPIPVPLAGNAPQLWLPLHHFRAGSPSRPCSHGCSLDPSLQLLSGVVLDLNPSLQGSPTLGPANSSGATHGALVCSLPATGPARIRPTSPLSFASSSTRC